MNELQYTIDNINKIVNFYNLKLEYIGSIKYETIIFILSQILLNEEK